MGRGSVQSTGMSGSGETSAASAAGRFDLLRVTACVAVTALFVAGGCSSESPGNDSPGVGDTVAIEGGAEPADPSETTARSTVPPAITEVGRESSRLSGGTRYRASIGGPGLTFEAEGEDWLAFIEDSALTITTGGDPSTGSIEVVRLVDAIDDGGVVVNTAGLAVPQDPFASVGDVITPDGVPDLGAIEQLPEDWLSYVASLPGTELSEPRPGDVGDLPATVSTISVDNIDEHPEALCAVPGFGRCVTVSVGLGFFSYLNDGSTGEISVVRVDGDRFAVTSTTRTGTPALRQQIDEMLASFRWAK
jgi:hypothetical protein